MEDDHKLVEQAPEQRPLFRLRPHGSKRHVGNDGAIYLVHAFVLIDDEGRLVTDVGVDGQQPIIIQSVPILVEQPAPTGRTRSGILIH